jgi:hypothetical protein
MVTRNYQEEPTIQRDCRTRRGLALIADQWTMLVIVALGDGTKRFSQLHAYIEGISKKMLTQTLREFQVSRFKATCVSCGKRRLITSVLNQCAHAGISCRAIGLMPARSG